MERLARLGGGGAKIRDGMANRDSVETPWSA